MLSRHFLSPRIGVVVLGSRFYHHASPVIQELKTKVEHLVAREQPRLLELKKKHKNVVVGDITAGMVVGGMRGIKAMITDTSDLDPVEGIRYRGRSLKEVNEALPKAPPNGKVGLPEGAFWLLMTGEVPTPEVVSHLNEELHRRSWLPGDVIEAIDALPTSMHPMTQLSIGILAMQPYSQFTQKYRQGGLAKKDYWEYILDDAITLIARVPQVAARVYRRSFYNSIFIETDPHLDWAGNFANMLGVSEDENFKEATRLYLTMHADHEGGNVSSHTTHLVGSALADPFYAWAAGVCGLAGPLHGLANQECLNWLTRLEKYHQRLGIEPSVESVTQYTKETMANGLVVPGYGHAVLRATDPRYAIEREFCLEHIADDPMFKLSEICYKTIPPILKATGKVQNPYPNVDALSGTMMQHYGLKESDYYTVTFAVSRTIGVMAQMIWARAMAMPIERPKSVTLDWLAKAVMDRTKE